MTADINNYYQSAKLGRVTPCEPIYEQCRQSLPPSCVLLC